MTQCRVVRQFWLLIGLIVGLTLLSVLLSLASGDLSPLIVLPVSVIPMLGAVILAKRPGNRIGLLMVVTGGVVVGSEVLDAYARFAVTHGGWPGAAWAAWLWNLTFWPVLKAYLVLLLLLFPTGNLVSPRWRIVFALFALITVAQMILDAVGTEPYDHSDTLAQLENPIGISALEDVEATLVAVTDIILLVVIALAVASVVVRFHRSRGVERQQLKWFVSTAVAIIALIVAMVISPPMLPRELGDLAEIVFGVAFLSGVIVGLPVTIAIAILRYRLYDIDQIVNRALVYTVLTAVLVGIYLLIVLGFGAVVQRITGESSQLVVAGSTLAVAAMFRPLRGRIQGAVDLRFYRHRYDAARTLDAFNTRLREEIDLTSLSSELQAVVRETMQPEHVSLWLRPGIHVVER